MGLGKVVGWWEELGEVWEGGARRSCRMVGGAGGWGYSRASRIAGLSPCRALAKNCNASIDDKNGGSAKEWKGGKPVRVVSQPRLH